MTFTDQQSALKSEMAAFLALSHTRLPIFFALKNPRGFACRWPFQSLPGRRYSGRSPPAPITVDPQRQGPSNWRRVQLEASPLLSYQNRCLACSALRRCPPRRQKVLVEADSRFRICARLHCIRLSCLSARCGRSGMTVATSSHQEAVARPLPQWTASRSRG